MDYHEKIAHMNLRDCAQYTKNTYGFQESVEEIMDIWNEQAYTIYTTEIELKPGTIELLNYFKKSGIKIAVANANVEYLYWPCLKRHDILSYFEVINDVDKCGVGKHSPLIFLECANAIQVPPARCIVLEDTIMTLKVTGDAGFITCALKERMENEEEKKKISDFYFSSLQDFFRL